VEINNIGVMKVASHAPMCIHDCCRQIRHLQYYPHHEDSLAVSYVCS
jgi:hypothetical protein